MQAEKVCLNYITVSSGSGIIFEGKVDESKACKLKEGMGLLLSIGALNIERFMVSGLDPDDIKKL